MTHQLQLIPYAPTSELAVRELVRLLEHSHSAAFRPRLARLVPDFPARQQWLREQEAR